MVRTIVGIKKNDYTNKEGKRVVGINIYTTHEDKFVEGVVTDAGLYLSQNFMEHHNCPIFQVGDEIEVFYEKNSEYPVEVRLVK